MTDARAPGAPLDAAARIGASAVRFISWICSLVRQRNAARTQAIALPDRTCRCVAKTIRQPPAAASENFSASLRSWAIPPCPPPAGDARQTPTTSTAIRLRRKQ